MTKQTHRICVRMNEDTYQHLAERSEAEGISMNACLMRLLESNRPVIYCQPETSNAIEFMNEAGRDINAVARAFNSGYGTADQLRFAARRLKEVYQAIYRLREEGYAYAE